MSSNKEAKYILSCVFNVSVNDIKLDVRLDNYVHWDSLGHMRLVLYLENFLGRSIEIEEVLSITDLDSIQKLIDSKL